MSFASRAVTFSILLAALAIAAALIAFAPEPKTDPPRPAPREQQITPAKVREAVRDEDERAFEQELEEIGASLEGKVGIAVVDGKTRRLYDFNGLELFPQQSVSKLWVALTALSLVDAGALDLSEEVSIRREDLTLFYQPIRDIVYARGAFDTDYADLVRRAITRSDNTANDRLLRRVGGAETVQGWINENDLGAIRFGRDERTKQSAIAGLEWRQYYSHKDQFFQARGRVPDDERRAAFERYLADPIDGATPHAIASAMVRLADGELLSDRSTELIRSTLGQTRSGPRRLKGGVPQGWRVEHKTGTGQVLDGEQSGYNDVGLLIAPDGREYGVAVMIGRTRENNSERMALMREVSAATARFHATREPGDADSAP